MCKALLGHPSKSKAKSLLSESLYFSGTAVGRDGAVNKLIPMSVISVLGKKADKGRLSVRGGWVGG